MVYIFAFISSSAIIFAAEKIYNRNKHTARFLFTIALLIPSVLAACRDNSVGTDTGAYIYYFNVIANEKSPAGALTNVYLNRVGLEPGYIILNYAVKLFFKDGHWMLGVMAFLTNLSILIGARNYRDRYPTWLIMIIYYFVFACVTFNIARQGLSNAIIFAGAILLEKKKYFKYILVILLAASIHFTAAIGGPLLLIMSIFLSKDTSPKRSVILIVSVFLGIYFYQIPMNFLLKLFPSYSSYATEYGNSAVNFSLLSLVLKAPFIVVATVWYKQVSYKETDYHIFYTYLWMDLLISQFGAFLGPLARLAHYFAYYRLLMAPEILFSYNEKSIYNRSNNRILVLTIIMLWIVIYWYIYTVQNMYGYGLPVYPYTSSILQI